MKRPALTWKAIENLESLATYAEGEMANYDYCYEDTKLGTDPMTRDAHAAIEWIKKCRRWKQEQEGKTIDKDKAFRGMKHNGQVIFSLPRKEAK